MDENPDGGSIFWFDLPRWSSEQDRGPDGEEVSGTRFFKLAELERAAKNERKLNARPRKVAPVSPMSQRS